MRVEVIGLTVEHTKIFPGYGELKIGFWNLFEIWNLNFGIFPGFGIWDLDFICDLEFP